MPEYSEVYLPDVAKSIFYFDAGDFLVLVHEDSRELKSISYPPEPLINHNHRNRCTIFVVGILASLEFGLVV